MHEKTDTRTDTTRIRLNHGHLIKHPLDLEKLFQHTWNKKKYLKIRPEIKSLTMFSCIVNEKFSCSCIWDSKYIAAESIMQYTNK